MPKYVKEDLHKSQIATSLDSQDTPNQWNRTAKDTAKQYAKPEDNSVPLPLEGIIVVRKIVGTFL